MTEFVNLVCGDKVLRVAPEVARMSGTITSFSQFFEEDDSPPVPIMEISYAHLEKTMRYCESFLKNEVPDPDSDGIRRVLGDWEKLFLDLDLKEDIYPLIEAANELDIPEFLQALMIHIASLIRGKTPDQIRATLGIVNDLTPEQTQQILNQLGWTVSP